MLAYMNTERNALGYGTPGFDGNLSRRRATCGRDQAVNVSYANKRLTITQRSDGQSFSVSCDDVNGITFVIDDIGMTIEIVATINGTMLSMLFHAPTSELDKNTVQACYDMAYDISGDAQADGRGTQVHDVIRHNKFFRATDNTATPTYPVGSQPIQTPTYQQNVGSNDIVSSLLGGGFGQSTYNNGTSNGGNMGYYDTSDMGMQASQQGVGGTYGSYGTTQPQANGNGMSDINEMRAMMDALMERMSNAGTNNRQEVNDLNDKLTKQYLKNEQLTKDHLSLQKELSEAKSQLSDRDVKLSDKDRKISELNNAIASAAESRDMLQQELTQTKAQLQQEKASAESQIATAKSATDATHAQLLNAQAQIKALNASIGEKDDKAQKDADTIADLQRQVRDGKSRISRLSDDIVTAKDAAQKDMDALKSKYEQRLFSTMDDLKKSRQETTQAKKDASKAIHDLTEKTIHKVQEQQDNFNAERNKMRSQMNDLSKLVDSVTSDRESLTNQISALTTSIGTLREQKDTFSTKIKDLESELRDAQQRLETTSKRNESLNKQILSVQQSADIARDNADKTTQYAAKKYKEAIHQRDVCESALTTLRHDLGQLNADPATLAVLDKAIASIVGTKATDNPMLMAAADNAVDTYNVNGVYMDKDTLDKEVDKIINGNAKAKDATDEDAHQQETEEDANDDATATAADEDYSFNAIASDEPLDDDIADEDLFDDGDDGNDDAIDVTVPSQDDGDATVAMPMTQATDDEAGDADASHGTDEANEDVEVIDDDVLDGTPLSNTGTLDAEQMKAMLVGDDDYDVSAE